MSTTESDPHGVHDWHSAEYVDEWISSDATRDASRQPWLARMAKMLPFDETAAIRVLDIGAGYAMLTREVVDRFPAAEVVLHDISEPMLDHARKRLEHAADRLTFVTADLRDPAWVEAVPGDFDAVVSSIAIHNVREPEVIRRVYADIRTLVRAGGCFLNIDFLPVGPLSARAMHGRGRAFPGGDGEVAGLEHHLQWLRDAGFDEADCLLRVDGQTLVGGFLT